MPKKEGVEEPAVTNKPAEVEGDRWWSSSTAGRVQPLPPRIAPHPMILFPSIGSEYGPSNELPPTEQICRFPIRRSMVGLRIRVTEDAAEHFDGAADSNQRGKEEDSP